MHSKHGKRNPSFMSKRQEQFPVEKTRAVTACFTATRTQNTHLPVRQNQLEWSAVSVRGLFQWAAVIPMAGRGSRTQTELSKTLQMKQKNPFPGSLCCFRCENLQHAVNGCWRCFFQSYFSVSKSSCKKSSSCKIQIQNSAPSVEWYKCLFGAVRSGL